MIPCPIRWRDVEAARQRIAAHVPITALRRYPILDEAVGAQVWVKHEHHLPTNAFKARNAMALMTSLDGAERARGVVAATRGNHGMGLAWAGQRLGVPVVICVPVGNNPGKNAAIRGLGAELIERGRDYDEAVAVATELVATRRLTMAHSTNNAAVLAGAATLSAELFEQVAAEHVTLDALVVAVGGGSQAMGAIVAAQQLSPTTAIHGVQAAGAAAIHDSWHARQRLTRDAAITIADGLATRSTYDFTFATLQAGLAGFVVVSEGELASAVRLLLRATKNLAEPAGAAGLAGLMKLGATLHGQRVGVVLSGANIDDDLLRRIVAGEL